jgi:hypothetical protein
MERFNSRKWLLMAFLPARIVAGQANESAHEIQERALRSPAYSWLLELTDSIGPRLTGSPSSVQAARWAAARMNEIGLENVRLEPWPLGSGWTRGTAEAELISPPRTRLNIASYGWTGSTRNGAVDADVIEVHREKLEGDWRTGAGWNGKIVFVASQSPVQGGAEGPQLDALVSTAIRAGAVAVIARDMRPGLMLTHTGPVKLGEGNKVYEIPVLDIAAEHQKLIERLLDKHERVRLRLNVQNHFVGSVPAANVSGEIRGAENPEQIVLLGAHLDSWDLGAGAIDDGMGVATVLAAAQAIKAAGLRPRRTIRVVLFTGEEEGLLGSRAWTRQHAADLPNLLCALVLDWGEGPITAIPVAGHPELETELAPMVELLNRVQKVRFAEAFLNFTDAYPFTLAGIPGLALYQESKDYAEVAHSAADTFDKVDAQTLARNAATLAVAGFWIADNPARIGTRWPRDEIPRRLTELKQRAALETLGLWPFDQ